MQAWKSFLNFLEKEMGKKTVEKWLRPLKVTHFDACNIYLEAKDQFQVVWFEEHIRSKVKSSLFNNNNSPIRVHLSTPQHTPEKKRKRNSPESPPVFELAFDSLDPSCTFDRLLVPEANQLTVKILHEVSGYQQDKGLEPFEISQKEIFNPIYLYGPKGSGKTHLLMATAEKLLSQGIKALYVRGETFVDHVVKAIRAAEMPLFREKYRESDVLLIDDVEVFAKKAASQEELFHTFNTLHLDSKQIILSSGYAPQELQQIEPRLVSRFEWGIVLAVEPLPSSESHKLLKLKSEAVDFPLTKVMRDFLIKNFQSSPNALVKAFNALVLRTHLHEQKRGELKLTIPQMNELLSDLLKEESSRQLNSSVIIHAVADHYGILTDDICGKSQSRECVFPRKIAMYLCRQKLKMPYTKLGKTFNRDHSTVMTSIRQIEEECAAPLSELNALLNAINKKLV